MTDLIRFNTAAELGSVAEAFLLRNETEHNLLLGLLHTLEVDPGYYGSQPYFACVIDGDEVLAAAVMTPPHGLRLSLCESDDALRLLANDVHKFRADTPGVTAPVPAGQRFAEAWCDIAAGGYKLSMAERIYSLEGVTLPQGVNGQARRATEDDLRILTDWRIAFITEAVPSETETHEEAERMVLRGLRVPAEIRGIFLWEDGEPVSFAGYGGPTPNSMRIGPVYTPPQFRRRGYASACTAAVCQYLLDSGRRFCTLFTDLSNPTSNHIYQQIGFRPVCDVDQYLFIDY